jgi:predicted nucleotidyltransferase
MTNITRNEIEEGMILFCKSGSHAYGLNIENSDLDFKGITIQPKRFFISFEYFDQKDKGWEPFDQTKFPQLDGSDSVVYGIRRYLSLLHSQNPNILEMIWQEPDDYLFINDLGQMLIDNREKLISKRISGTFIQYARAQIKKMETHRKWLLEPPMRKPQWEDYGVDSNCLSLTQIGAFIEYLYLLIKDKIQYYNSYKDLYTILTEDVDWKGVLKQNNLPEECVEMTQSLTRGSDDYMVLLRASQSYRADLKRWENYQDWMRNRNVKRSEIEKHCGYDGKNASHCVRLMKMAIECMRSGELIVNRQRAGDSELLLSIKLGRLTYEELSSIVNGLFVESEDVLNNHCILPNQIDHDFSTGLCAEIVERSGILS